MPSETIDENSTKLTIYQAIKKLSKHQGLTLRELADSAQVVPYRLIDAYGGASKRLQESDIDAVAGVLLQQPLADGISSRDALIQEAANVAIEEALVRATKKEQGKPAFKSKVGAIFRFTKAGEQILARPAPEATKPSAFHPHAAKEVKGNWVTNYLESRQQSDRAK